MALKYYSEFYGEQTDSLYRIELWDSTFGGASTLLNMGYPGYELTYDSQADDLFTPIKSSSVKLYWMVENSTVQSYFEGLINKQEGEIVINIIFAGSTIWQGTVITEQVQFEHASYPLLCTMNAVDGIGRLKGIEWSSANWSSVIYPGGVPLPIIPLNKLLADIFLHCTDYVDTSLGTLLTTNVIVEHDGMDLQSFNQIPEAMGFEFEAFKLLDGESQDGRVYWYYYDVLLEVCRSLGARVYFSDGRWVFRQVIQEQYYSTTIYNNFDFSGDFVNGGSIDWSADYDTLEFKWLAEPVDTFSQPIKKLILPAYSKKNLVEQTIPIPTYEYTSSNFEANNQHVLYWDLDSLVQVPINGMLNKKLQFKLDFNITDQDKLQRVKIFYIRLYIRTTAGTWYALSNYNSTTQSHWNNNPVGPNPLVWTSGVNPATADNNHVQQYYGGQTNGSIEFISPPCPIDDIDEVVFMIGASGLGVKETRGYITNGTQNITSCADASSFSAGDTVILGGIYTLPNPIVSIGGNKIVMTTVWASTSQYWDFMVDITDKSIQNTDTTLIEINSVTLAQVDEGEYINDKGTAYITTNPLDATIVVEEPLYKVLDNIGGNLKTAIRFYDGVGWDYTQQDWKILPSIATETGRALIQKLSEYKMRYNRKSMYVIEGTIQAGLYRPELVLLYRSLVWVFIGGTYTANDELWKVTYMAIDLAGEADIDFDPDIDSNYAPNVDSNKKPYIDVKIDKLDRNDSNIYTAANGALSILQTTKAELEALIYATPIVQYIPSGTTLPTTNVLNGEWQLQAEDGQTNVYIDNAWQRGVKLITDTTGDLRYVKRDGSTPLTGNWNAGAYSITANSVVIGSAANTISGGTASGGNITIQSTTHATKGNVIIANSRYNEVNNWLGINVTPAYTLDVYRVASSTNLRAVNIVIADAASIASPTYGAYVSNSMVSSNIATWGIYSIATSGSSSGGNPTGLQGEATSGNSNVGVRGVGRADNSRSGYGIVGYVARISGTPTTLISGFFETANLATTTKVIHANLAISGGDNTHYLYDGLNNGSSVWSVRASGKMFVGGSTAPTANIHIAAGSATANTAPIKLTTGTVNTVAEAGAFEYTTPTLYFTNGGAQRQEIPQIQQSRVSSQFDKTDTTLANVTGLTATLVAGKTYHFEATLFIDADATGGSKYAIAGTCTATAIKYQIQLFDNSTNTLTINARQTALAGSSGQASTTAGFVKITGMITVNAAGTLTVQFAQNAANGTSSVLTLSSFKTREIA